MKKVFVLCRNDLSIRLTSSWFVNECLLDCLIRNEAPFHSEHHYWIPNQAINNHYHDREKNAGHAWLEVTDCIVVYQDFGLNERMQEDIDYAKKCGVPIEYRTLENRPTIK